MCHLRMIHASSLMMMAFAIVVWLLNSNICAPRPTRSHPRLSNTESALSHPSASHTDAQGTLWCLCAARKCFLPECFSKIFNVKLLGQVEEKIGDVWFRFVHKNYLVRCSDVWLHTGCEPQSRECRSCVTQYSRLINCSDHLQMIHMGLHWSQNPERLIQTINCTFCICISNRET